MSAESLIPRFEKTLVDSNGVKVDVDCEITNIHVNPVKWERNTKGNPFDDVVNASADLDTILTINAKIDGNELSGIPDKITLCEVPLAGIGYIKVVSKLEINGSVKASKTTHHHFEIGYDDSAYFSYDCEEEPMALEAHAKLDAGIRAEIGLLDLHILNGSAYVNAGIEAHVDAYRYADGKQPSSCINLSAWVYANAGASFKVLWKSWEYTYTIFDESNSPIKLTKHIEDLLEVSVCSRAGQVDADGRMNNGVGYNGLGNGWSVSAGSHWSGVGYWRTSSTGKLIYTYDEEKKTASVKSWTGSGAVVIPETTEKAGLTYTVTGIEDSAFEEENNDHKLYAVSLPDTIVTIGYGAFSNCSLIKK